MAFVELDCVTRRFGEVTALDELSLAVADGEFVVMLGPSGCGKTTALRLVAGFERLTSGDIRLDGMSIRGVPAGRRNIALVFQSYALYPHMSVYDNLAFGPRVRHEDRVSTRRNIEEVAEKLELTPLLKRKPRELSGGQRQRVALGRALLRRPEVFLMDEPLSNLDAALRTEVRGELNRLHQELGITTIYVTHDQTEAMSLGDRVAVMSKGKLQQAGAPQDVYDDPVNTTVARFLGSPPMNLLPGALIHSAGRWMVTTLDTSVDVVGRSVDHAAEAGREVLVGFRPGELEVGQNDGGPGSARGEVEIVERMGSESWITVKTFGRQRIVCRAAARASTSPGELVSVTLPGHLMRVFDLQTGQSLLRSDDAAPATSQLARRSEPVTGDRR